jgi:hypothetical protein
MADQPWHELPPDIASVLRPTLSELADEIIDAVRGVPDYARPLDGPFGATLRTGVQEGLRHFLAEIEAGGAVARPDVLRELGRGEMRAGRSLNSLLSAYRVGARVAWRRFAAAGVQAGLDPDTLYLLAESLFAYIDVLSSESAEGHALEQSAAAGEAERRRRQLVRMLVRVPPVDPESMQAAAREAGWPLPRKLAAIVIAGENPETVVGALPAGVIAETLGESLVAIVPDPDAPARRAALERAIVAAETTGGLGTSVEWPDAAISLTRARAALELSDGAPGLMVAREYAGELLLRSDPRLAEELASDRLAALAELPVGARARLTETLGVWLAEQGRLARVADRLGIHPQTARYRLARLRELFGSSLEDPDERFWLQLALRARDQRPAAT